MSTIQEALTEAVQHHQASRLDRAETLYRQIVRVDSSHANALHLLGVLQCQRGNAEAAVSYIQRAIAVDNSTALYHFNLGIAYRALGQLDNALKSLRQAISLDSAYAAAHFQIGVILELRGEIDLAVEAFQKAVQFQRDNPQFQFRLGSTLATINRCAEAIEHFQIALRLRPGDANTHNSLGSVLQKLGRLDEAAAEYQTAIALQPDFGPYHFNLGNVLREQDRFHQSVESYQAAIRLAPDDIEAQVNLGVALKESGRLGDALDYYDHLLESLPDLGAARFNRSLVLLQSGELARGWDEYKWRSEHGQRPRTLPQPEWDGSLLANRSIFIHAEQGVGDEIQFASCLPDVLAQAENCVVECDPRLVPLFVRSFPSAKVVAKRSDLQFPSEVTSADIQIAIGSLPRYLRRKETSFPVHGGYLMADDSQRALWKARFENLGDGLKIGISWRGGKEADVRRRRSTRLEQWLPLLTVEGVNFVNLQYGDCREEMDHSRCRTHTAIHDWEDANPLKNLDFLAAQIAALDLVISVDNATVHMAGALGRPVWTLLPFASDWRWMLGRKDTPWYPTMQLFRQSHPGDWTEVFQNVRQELLRRKEEAHFGEKSN